MLSFTLLPLLVTAAIGAEPAVTISGAVVDNSDRPLADVEVLLSDGPMVNVRLERLLLDVPRPPQVIARTTTDADGKFSFGLAEDGCESYWARTWLVLWAHRPGSALTTDLLGRDWPANAAPITVRLADVPAMPIEVAAPDGSPRAGARVSPEQVDGVRLPRELAPRLSAVSDRAGRAVLRDVTPASLDLVRIETESYGIQWASLPAAGANGARKITLSPVATISGSLASDDPRAVAAVPIRLASWLTAGDDAAGGGLAAVISGADGRFEVSAIVAGALSVRVDEHVELPFRAQATVTGRPLAEGATTELTIKLERAARVEGVVRDRDSGAPLAGAAVWLDYSSRRNLPRSDAKGKYGDFLLPGQVSPSPWRMPGDYYFPQYALDTEAVPVGAKHVGLKPLLLARGTTLHGRVVDAAGQSVPGAEIVARWGLASGGENAAYAWSGRDGAFALYGVATQVQVDVSACSIHGTTAKAVVVHPAKKEPIELVVSPANGLRLEGRVVDTFGHPVSGATVRIRGQRRDAQGHREHDAYVCFGGRQRLSTDDEGRFRTPTGLMAGRQYRAEAMAPGMLPATSAVMPWASSPAPPCGTTRHGPPRFSAGPTRCLSKRRRKVSARPTCQSIPPCWPRRYCPWRSASTPRWSNHIFGARWHCAHRDLIRSFSSLSPSCSKPMWSVSNKNMTMPTDRPVIAVIFATRRRVAKPL